MSFLRTQLTLRASPPALQLPGLSMRLDHFVVSSALMSRVEACDVAAPPEDEARREDAETRGPRRTHPNHYYGSDHWPLWIRLRAKTHAA